MADEVRVQHIFRDPETGFTDALVLPKDEYEKLGVDAIETLKAERITAHRELLAAAPVEAAPPTAEELEAELAAVREQKAALEAREVELVASVDAVAEVVEAPVKRVR